MKTLKKNPYTTLGVPEDATDAVIKSAYKKLAMEHHPDRPGGGSHERMAEINWAYEVLSDPQKRAHFDQFGYDEGDNSAISPVEHGILQIWSDLIANNAFEPNMDYIECIRNELMTRIREEQKEIAALEKRLPKFKKLRTHIVKKDGDTKTIFHIHIDKTIAAAESHLKAGKAKLDTMAQQIAYLKDFSFQLEKRAMPPYSYSPDPGLLADLMGNRPYRGQQQQW